MKHKQNFALRIHPEISVEPRLSKKSFDGFHIVVRGQKRLAPLARKRGRLVASLWKAGRR